MSFITFLLFQGDSGGPITVEDGEGHHTMVGVVSHGVSVTCGQAGADVHMKVAAFIPWINKTIVRQGGMASCNYMLTANPDGESPKEAKSYGVLLTGGKDSGSNPLASVEFLGPGDCPVPTLPEPRSGHVSFITSDDFLATCGGWVQRTGRASEPQTDCIVLIKEEQAWKQGVMGSLMLKQYILSCPTVDDLATCIFPYVEGQP